MKRIFFRLFTLLLMLSVVLYTAIARADDLEEFKAAVLRYNDSLAHWDADIIANIEAEAFGFTHSISYLTRNKIMDKELWKQQLKVLRTQYDYYDMNIVIAQANVIGNTGIACGNYKISRKHKEYPWVSAKKRWSSTWIKTNNQWKLVFYHFELIDAWR